MAFAAAFCFAVALPRWSAAFFTWAILVALERVLENAHYVSDVVAGAGLGIGCGWLAVWITGRLMADRLRPGFEVVDPKPRDLQLAAND
jgi:membrane-associated phospholipid phosphatase